MKFRNVPKRITDVVGFPTLSLPCLSVCLSSSLFLSLYLPISLCFSLSLSSPPSLTVFHTHSFKQIVYLKPLLQV